MRTGSLPMQAAPSPARRDNVREDHATLRATIEAAAGPLDNDHWHAIEAEYSADLAAGVEPAEATRAARRAAGRPVADLVSAYQVAGRWLAVSAAQKLPAETRETAAAAVAAEWPGDPDELVSEPEAAAILARLEGNARQSLGSWRVAILPDGQLLLDPGRSATYADPRAILPELRRLARAVKRGRVIADLADRPASMAIVAARWATSPDTLARLLAAPCSADSPGSAEPSEDGIR